MEFVKKNQYWISLLSGIILSLAAYLFNPFGLDAVANKAVAVAVLMITWWISEALPMPAVALIPLVLLPLLNIKGLQQSCDLFIHGRIHDRARH